VTPEPAPPGRAESSEPQAPSPAVDFTAGGAGGDIRGRIVARYRPAGWEEPTPEPEGEPSLEGKAELLRLLDPASAIETVHWGRNYIYLAHLSSVSGTLPVAVKQFPGGGWRRRLRRRFRDGKADRSWRTARDLQRAGLLTPEPVLKAESADPGGATWFVTRYLDDVFEARYLLRAMNEGRTAEAFPRVDEELFLDTLGRMVRHLHRAGFWHRDLSSGNVLVRWHEDRAPELYLVDLNRTRKLRRLSLSQRTRDLSRMMIHLPPHQERFLRAYWGDDRRLGRSRRLYHLYHRSFRAKNRVKNKIKRLFRRLKSWLFSRGAHPHIPEAPRGASPRDRVVWDALSDQPHLHAGRFDKLRVRLADADAHLAQTAALLRALPRIRRRYRELKRTLYAEPVPFAGAGVAVRPWPEGGNGSEPHPELLAAIEDSGVRHVLLRLHPWQAEHTAEKALAKALADRGFELTFTLPQNRELVGDLCRGGSRWREAVAALAEDFTPYGRSFQVGQAINRSKWGVWNAREWAALTRVAMEELHRYPGVRVLGPGVIDFELHQTAGLVNYGRADFRLDALASLLYVDRRGAPENRQLGFDTVDKAVLLKAIAETARHCGPESWITEVNWPLWEGPHSPAGKGVAVDEETQASYLVRFYVLTLTTGLVARVFWWRMVARGYGLVAPPASGTDRFRRRPSFHALRHLVSRLEGAVSLGPLPAPAGVRLFGFRLPEGNLLANREVVVGWTVDRPVEVELPAPVERIWDRDGEEREAPATRTVSLHAAPRYILLAPSESPADADPAAGE